MKLTNEKKDKILSVLVPTQATIFSIVLGLASFASSINPSYIHAMLTFFIFIACIFLFLGVITGIFALIEQNKFCFWCCVIMNLLAVFVLFICLVYILYKPS